MTLLWSGVTAALGLMAGYAWGRSSVPSARVLSESAWARLRLLTSEAEEAVGTAAPSMPGGGSEEDKLARRLSLAVASLRARVHDEHDLSRGVFEAMAEGVLLTSDGRTVLRVNPAFREMFLVDGDVAGRPWLEILRADALRDGLDAVAEGSEQSHTTEVRVPGIKPRTAVVRTVRALGGGTLSVFVDVTEVRRLESLRRDFVANVSHELRTPVTSVLSAAETLRMTMEHAPEVQLNFVGMIERNAERLRALIDDLLDLTRIESNALRLHTEPVELESFFEHVASLFHERAERRRIELSVEAPEGLRVKADRRALEQVFANLTDNAIKYVRERDKVTLRGVVARSGQVVLSVEDSGPGIGAEHLPRLFERFYRVDPGRAREQGGTGLGLAIAKHLVESMGGDIVAESELGRGTRFVVTLPEAKS